MLLAKLQLPRKFSRAAAGVAVLTLGCGVLIAAALEARQAPTGATAQNKPPHPAGFGDWPPVKPLTETGFQPIFDGKTLDGWDCDPDFWRVEGGAIVGETKMDHQPKQNIFCIWRGGQPADFEFRAQYKMTGVNDGNSGIQFRSNELPNVAKWVMQGYQADIDLKQMFTGQIYEERARGFLALRGMLSYIPSGGKVGSIGSLGDGDQLKSLIKDNDWNDLVIIARGNTMLIMLNGRVMSELIDDDAAGRKMSGEIGIQLHRLPNCSMKMETRNIRLKTF